MLTTRAELVACMKSSADLSNDYKDIRNNSGRLIDIRFILDTFSSTFISNSSERTD